MTKIRNDYRVYAEETVKGKAIWRIRIGGKKGTTIISCNSIEKANETARQLNIDPWYLGRGNTRADRSARR